MSPPPPPSLTCGPTTHPAPSASLTHVRDRRGRSGVRHYRLNTRARSPLPLLEHVASPFPFLSDLSSSWRRRAGFPLPDLGGGWRGKGRNAMRRLVRLLAVMALLAVSAVAASRLDLDELDESEVLDALLAVDEEEDAAPEDGGAAEAVRRTQSMVLVLDNDNARRAVEEHAQLLLLGYAPWCERSAQLMPRFAEAAAALRDMGSAVAFAKLDGERFPKAAAAVGVSGFPTVLLFVNGTEHTYTGLHTKDGIVTWVRKKTGTPVITLQSKDSAEAFLKKGQTFAIGFFKNYEGAEHEEFVKAATAEDEVQFVETNDRDVAKILFPSIASEEQFLGLVKSEPEKFEKFDGASEEKAILQFVELNKFPLVTVFTDLNSAKVYGSPIKLQVFTFAEAYDFEDLESIVQEVARGFKTKIMFVYVDTAEENLAKPFLTLYGLEGDKPTVTAFNTNDGSKYLLEADINTKNLKEFCLSLLDGTLPPYFRSEKVPEEKGLVEKVVGRTLDSSVLESPQHVFLEAYAPWCVDCEAISKNIEKLAKHFSGLDNLKFARIDASVNEHPKLKVNNYPTLLLYPADDKANPIKLSKKLSIKDMTRFIKEKLQISDVEIKESLRTSDVEIKESLQTSDIETVVATDGVKDEL